MIYDRETLRRIEEIEQRTNGEHAPSDATDAVGSALAECLEVFQRWLYLPDAGALYVALGNVAANLLPGDPAWLLVVGPPSCGKTEVVGAFATLGYVYPAATLTEAALLSGSPKREKAKDATGGLLRQLGDFGVILCKDFGSVMSMHRDERARVLAALREVYDGSWTRLLGVDGGRSLRWQGKCGFLGACTPSIDRAHAVMGALGERFVLYRISVDNPNEQGRRRLANRGHERAMRDDLFRAVTDVLAAVNGDTPAPLSELEVEWLVAWACFAVVARSAVERDGYDRQVELLPEPEAPGRLVGALGQLSAGLSAIGLTDRHRWLLLAKVAADSIPTIRRAVLDLLRAEGWVSSSTIIERTGIPRTTTGRTLEDLILLGLVNTARVDGTEPTFGLSDSAVATWPQPCPEMSGNYLL